MMNTLELAQIIEFHRKIVHATGGSDGIRDIGLIESALVRAQATFGGQELYPDSIQKIAIISYGLIKNHGFVDGNKRIGVASMLLLLRMNEIQIEFTQDEIVELGLQVAAGKMDENQIEEWIRRHQV